MSMDFNTAEKQFSGSGDSDFTPIPDDTIVTVVMSVRPGSVGDGGWLTQSQSSSWQYLNCEFVVIGGDYDKRRVWQNMMWFNPEQPDGQAGNITKSNIRSMLESARGVNPDDESPDAQAKRQINEFGDLCGLQFQCKLKIEPAKGSFPAKNQIKSMITPDMSEYVGGAPTYAASQPTQATTLGAAAANVVQQAAPSNSGSLPAWAQ